MTSDSGYPDSTPPALRRSPLQQVGWWLLFLVTLAIAAQYIWQFSVSRDISWDEGYLMITMRGFLDGHALYDEVFTQYGPAYYMLRAPLFAWLEIPLDHNWTRLLCMATWVAAAGLLAAAMWRATGSLLLCWLALLQAIVHLTDLGNEPGHPQELVALLLAAIVFVLANARGSRITWPMIAVLVAMLGMIKINVGVFALLGIGLVHVSTLRRLPVLLAAVFVLFLGSLPLLLMWRHLAEAWAASYAATAAGTIIATSLCLLQQQRLRAEPLAVVPLPTFLLVLAAAAAVPIAVILVHGTTLAGLVDGLLLAPLRLADVYVLPIKATPWAVINALAAVLCAAVYCWQVHSGRTPRWISAFKLIFGVAGALLLAAAYERQLLFLAPWLWLTIVAPHARNGDVASRHSETFRYVVCALAAFQLLQAYPVAGSQLAWSTLLLIVAYTVCLHDVLQHYRERMMPAIQASSITPPPPPPARARIAMTAVACLLVLATYTTLWMELPRLRAHYATVAPLPIPGANLVRLNASLNSLYVTLTGYLKTDSDSFVTYPGFHSLYLLTGMAPPTHYNVTVWDLLSDAQQTAIVDGLRKHARPRIVLVRDPRNYWRSLDPANLRPFERLVLDEYEDAAIIGPAIILAPRNETPHGSPAAAADAAVPGRGN